MINDEYTELLTDTFFSYGHEKIAEFPAAARFAHYTSADVAMRIISASADERCIWLRNASEMNDFSEVEYGQHCLMECLRDEALRTRFRAAVDAIHPNVLATLAGMLDEERDRIKRNTYLLSLAVHEGPELDRGVLSMWRAYGGSANVCMLLNTAPFLTPQTAYSAYISPVFYDGPEGFKSHLLAMIERLEANCERLQNIDPNDVVFNFKLALDSAVLSTKHPSFAEEKEWRVIYRPAVGADDRAIPSKIVEINGIVQRIFYLPMQNVPEKGLAGAELDQILFRLVIGPTPNPAIVWDAFVQILADAGVVNPQERVVVSNVPLRR